LTAWGRDSDVGRASDGQPVAKIGNNGMSRHRHVHIGAWKDDTPYQIRSYLNAMGVAKQAESADPNDGSGAITQGNGVPEHGPRTPDVSEWDMTPKCR
jgi:hypothetical protein